MADVVVVLPGITGSTLYRHGTPVWAPTPGGLIQAIRTLAGNLRALELPAGIGDEDPGDGVEARGLMPDVHALPGLWTPIKGYDLLVARLRGLGYRPVSDDADAPPGNLLPFPYDWRLSNRHTARRLAREASAVLGRWRAQGGPHADARLVLVGHSMGGLIAHRFIACEGGAEITRAVITFGTPYRGAATAVAQLVNGVRKGLGPLAVDLTAFARSMPALHQLLPEYACIDQGGTGELLRTTEIALPDLNTAMVTDAMAFHDEINAACPTDVNYYRIIGARQPTPTTVRLTADGAETLDTYRDGRHREDHFGDATVPRAGATPRGMPLNSPLLHPVVDQHSNLQRNPAALDIVAEAITGTAIVPKAPPTESLRVRVPDLVLRGEPLSVEIDADGGDDHALRRVTTGEDGTPIDVHAARTRDGHATTSITNLPPGAHTIMIESRAKTLAPVTSTVLVWDRRSIY